MDIARLPRAPTDRRESPIAIAALVTGGLSLSGFGFLTGIPAIMLALIGLRRKVSGRRFLIGGLVAGILGTLFSLFLLLYFFWMIGFERNRPQAPYPNAPREQIFESTKT